jgi:hypothetical protein
MQTDNSYGDRYKGLFVLSANMDATTATFHANYRSYRKRQNAWKFSDETRSFMIWSSYV